MPELSVFGQALMGVGETTVSVDRVPYLARGGRGGWWDPGIFLANAFVDDRWQIVQVSTLTGLVTSLDDHGGANALCAGGARWLGWTPARGLFGSLGERSAAGLIAAGADGTLAWCPNYQTGRGLALSAPDGTGTVVGDALVVDRQLQILGPDAALWLDFNGGLRVTGRAPVRPALPAWRTRLVAVAGEDWLVYWSEGTGLIAQIDGAREGYLLESRPIAFNHDAVAVGDQLIVAWSTTSGEAPGDLVWMVVDRTAPRIPLSEPIAAIGRPCWLGWFEFGEAPETPFNCFLPVRDPMFVVTVLDGVVHLVAHYVAGTPEGDIDALERALAAAHADWPGVPTVAYWTRGLQTGRLPVGANIIGIEAYRGVDESLTAFDSRIRGAAVRCRRVWLIAQGYTQPLPSTLTTELTALVPIYARIVRDCPSIDGVLVFSSGSRAGGWDDHPEIHDAWRALAAGIPGPPALESEPPPVPAPPTPAPPAPPAEAPIGIALPYEVTMDAKTVAFRLGQFFARIDPGEAGQGPFGYFPVHFDRRDTRDPLCRFELTQPDEKLRAKHLSTGALLGIDATEYVPDLCAQFYGKPGERGAYESLSGWSLGPDGIPIVLVEYDRDGAKYASACLTVVEL